MNLDALRSELVRMIDGEDAHMTFEEAVADFPAVAWNLRPPRVPYTPWQLLEHIRLTQRDLLEYVRDPDYRARPWPEGYWPAPDASATADGAAATIHGYLADREALRELVEDTTRDLFGPVPTCPEHTVFRELRLAADHTAYHVGEFAILRQVMGTWPPDRAE